MAAVKKPNRAKLTEEYLRLASNPANRKSLGLPTDPAIKEFVVWDDTPDTPTGFGVRFQGKKMAYVLQRRFPTGKPVKLTLGAWPDMAVKTAREAARRKTREITDGINPAEKAKPPMTFAELLTRYREEYQPLHQSSEKTRSECQGFIRREIEKSPSFSGKLVKDITQSDVKAFMIALAPKPITANRCLEILRVCFAMATKAKEIADDPTKDVPPYKEKGRETWAPPEDVDAILSALDEYGEKQPVMAALLKCYLYTGARKDELRNALASKYDRERGALTVKGKTGWRELTLSRIARIEVDKCSKDGYLFSVNGRNRFGTTTIYEHRAAVEALAKKKGMKGEHYRIHDLRHTFASLVLRARRNLKEVQEMLGHATIQTTMRYAHILDEDRQEVANEVADTYFARTKAVS